MSEGVYVIRCHAAIRTVLFAPGSTEKKGGCHGHGLDRMPKPFAVVWARVVLEARGCLAVSGQKDPARVGVKKMHAALDQPVALEWPKKERILMGRNEKPHPYGCGFLWARAVARHQYAPRKKYRLQEGQACHMRSKIAAMPWPAPMHMVTSARLPPVRCNSINYSPVRQEWALRTCGGHWGCGRHNATHLIATSA